MKMSQAIEALENIVIDTDHPQTFVTLDALNLAIGALKRIEATRIVKGAGSKQPLHGEDSF